MMQVLLLALFMAIAGCLGPIAGSDANLETTEPDRADRARGDRFAAVDAFFAENLDRVGGGAALILFHNGKPVYRAFFGTFTPETRVPVASATKAISGATVMSLVDDGVLTLDTAAGSVLPSYTDEKAGLTVRQLFGLTHGIADSPKYHRQTQLTLEQAVFLIGTLPQQAAPGTELFYSGAGMQVVAGMATRLENQDWMTIFQERIGAPCAMSTTDYFGFGITENPNVAGSVQTTADEFANFVQMTVQGGRFGGQEVLSPAALRAMWTNQTADVPIVHSPVHNYLDFYPELEGSRYGVGYWLHEFDPDSGRATLITSPGAFGCSPFWDHTRGLAGVYFVYQTRREIAPSGNFYNPATLAFWDLKTGVLDALFPPVQAPLSAGSGQLRVQSP